MAPTLAAAVVVVSSITLNATLTTAAFTPATGEVLVLCSGAEDQTATVPAALPTATGGGITWTQRVDNTTTGKGNGKIWTGTVTSGGSSITVSLTWTGTLPHHSMALYRWTGAQLATTPASGTATGSGAPSTTITTTAANSVVVWCSTDNVPVSPASRTYNTTSATPTDDGLDDRSSSSDYVAYYAHQTAVSAGSQTVGLTAPTGQGWKILAIEVQAASAVVTLPPPQLLVLQAVNRASTY